MAWPRMLSIAVTVLGLAGGLVVGGGLPPSPATLAREAGQAADNARIAQDNLAKAERDTRALAEIARHVLEQVEASRRLLATQLDIEASSRSSAALSEQLEDNIASIHRSIRRVAVRLTSLSRAAATSGAQAEGSADAAARLEARLTDLKRLFDELIEQSRELDRKARGYEQLRDGPS